MKYLILGSSGQIGFALTEYLRKIGNEVLEFDIARSLDEDLRIHANPKLENHIRNCDFVFFLAFDVGGSLYLKKYQNTYEFISNNIKIMNTVFDMLKKYNKPFIFASSQMSNMSYSPYGVLKAIGEYYTRALNGLIVKFWNVYGVERDLEKMHVITDFILKAKSDRCIKMLTDGREERQFLYSEDVCEALVTLAGKYAEIPRDQELHITSFEWTTIMKVAEIVASNFKGIKIIPAAETDILQKNKRNEPDPFIFNYWKPETSLEEGISNIIRYHQEVRLTLQRRDCK